MPFTWPSARHIYLSPHLDDAVLSCGGLIARQAQRGEPVAVVTVFAASPPLSHPLSPLARALHVRWQVSAPASSNFSDPPAARRAEDLRALATLGPSVQAVHYTLPDCIYRLHPATGQPLYAGEQALFGSVHPDDPARADLRTAPPLPSGAVLYVPLGVGGHVDHRIVREAVAGWGLPEDSLRYYEDYPYAAQPGALEAALAEVGPVRPLVVSLPEGALEVKIRAAACYESQISTFWSGLAAMAEALRAEAARIGGERLWSLAPRSARTAPR